MCGISGFAFGAPRKDSHATLMRMTRAIAHRGPDGEGFWVSDCQRVGFGHRRLAIVDLSESGHQPMASESGRYVITFNGEVYNFRELRGQLESLGHQFRGTSDTEVMLAAFEQWGVRKAIERFVGMFAFALWDKQDERLYLARDRLGKKPLYYSFVGDGIAFASELKSLRAVEGFRREVDRTALALYMRHNYVPAPFSIYSGTQKLRAGAILAIQLDGNARVLSEERYWNPVEVDRAARAKRFTGSFDEAVGQFRHLLEDAVRLRMVADVPLGAFLSGGIDSSLIVAMMARVGSGKVRTFTIGFDEAQFDEASYARDVAKHLGTEHTEMYVTSDEARAVIPKLPDIYDEPFADSSQIPTFLVSQLARQHVTVALSGDGGDELCCGYNRYLWMRSLWTTMRSVPRALRRVAGFALKNGGASALSLLLRAAGPLTPGALRSARSEERLYKLADALACGNGSAIYRQLISHWREPERLVMGVSDSIPDVAQGVADGSLEELIESLMTVDTANYLPDDILVKVDRASMAVSLEARAPLLDHRLFELTRSFPLEYMLRGATGKLPLREVLRDFVPTKLIDRPKTGFGVPLGSWLRGPLREWADDLLSPSRLRREGLLDTQQIQTLWEKHVRGEESGHYLLWDVLMLESWLDNEAKTSTSRLVGEDVVRAFPNLARA